MKRRILLQVVLPLGAATALAILVHLQWSADGFFMNLAAGFVGSLITVGYIDWILQRDERERWKEADARIASRLRRIAMATITGIRTSFGYGTEVFDRDELARGDSDAMQAEVLRVALRVLVPTADARVAALDAADWRRFASHLQQVSADCGVLLDRFGHRFSPNTVATLLDLQQSVESAQVFWRVFPDIAGVPAEQLPSTNTPPLELQAAWCQQTAKDIRRALELAVQLSNQASKA